MVYFLRVFGVFSFLFALSGCSDVTSGSTSLSSSTCEERNSGLLPPPLIPQSNELSVQEQIDQFPKFKIDPALIEPAHLGIFGFRPARLPKNTALSVMMDLSCTSTSNIWSLTKEKPLPPAGPIPLWSFSMVTEREMTLEELRVLANAPCVRHISNDTMARPFYSPSDPLYSTQAHFTTLNAPAAWDTFYGATGATSTVVIAIIDNGVELTHSDLSSNLWTNSGEIAGNSLDDDGNGYIDDVYGYNFQAGIGDPSPQSGASHGTHVAGLAAAREGNSVGGVGVMGRNIQIMTLNVFGTSGSASATDINNGITYAGNKRAHVMNLSLGGPGTSSGTQLALLNAVNVGTTIVAAAGNDAQEITSGNFVYPAGYASGINGFISVASVDALTSAISSFSNYSTTYVEIAAPGSNSSAGGLLATTPSNQHGYKQGTSMASPVTAGAAALAVSMSLTRGLSSAPSTIETALKDSSRSLSALRPYVQNGRILDLSRLANNVTGCP